MGITMKGISKAFGSNEVLKGVDLTLKSGEIHALMGENGAGKSTLMNILTGIHKADSGTICVDGREISFKNALEAEKCGIAFILIHKARISLYSLMVVTSSSIY